MIKLKPCPCGKTPEKLNICDGDTFRWRIVSGDCCGEWMIEVKVPTLSKPIDYDEYEWCCQDWNDAPRGGMK